MKQLRPLFLFLAMSFTLGLLHGQTTLKLEIRHLLGSDPFAFNTPATNNLGNTFDVSRLQYYISGISLSEDGEVFTDIPDLWFLIDAGSPTLVELGSVNLSQVKAIAFYVGVDSAHNHLDPAQYPLGHPLAPQAPSMHWGWNAGYRFLAFEGRAGNALNQRFELHGLGNNNYFRSEVVTDLTLAGGEMLISLDADYTGILHGIDVSGGLIVHGDYDEAADALRNIPDHVFSLSSPNTSIGSTLNELDFQVYPNPATGDLIMVSFDKAPSASYEVVVFDLLGKEVSASTETQLSLDAISPGMYIVGVRENGKLRATQKLIVK